MLMLKDFSIFELIERFWQEFEDFINFKNLLEVF